MTDQDTDVRKSVGTEVLTSVEEPTTASPAPRPVKVNKSCTCGG
jgi:hypothetical protein